MKRKGFLVALVCMIVLASFGLGACSFDYDIEKIISEATTAYRESLLDAPVYQHSNLSREDLDEEELTYHISDGYESVYSKHTAAMSFDGLLAAGSMDNVWYPGALMKLSYNEEEDNKIISSSLPRAPITISASLATVTGISSDSLVARIDKPSNKSEVNKAVSSIVNKIYQEGYKVDIPVNLSCTLLEVTQNQSLDVEVGVNVGFGGFSLDSSFGFRESTDRTRAVLALKQIYFTIDADRPLKLKDCFEKGVSDKEIVDEFSDYTVPVYCSVVYGRIALVAIETDLSMTELKASLNAGYGSVFDLNASLESLYQQSQTSMSFYLYGGSSETANAIKSSTLNEFIEQLTETELGAPLPIGYRFYYMDGNLAKISNYTEYYTKKMLPIAVDDFSFSMHKFGEANSTNAVQAGDVLGVDLFVSPSSARIFDITYSISPCYDFDGNHYAEINAETGRLRIFENAVVGERIKVTATLTQWIDRRTVTKICDRYIEVKEIPVKRIVIQPNNAVSSITRGGIIDIISDVFPLNASNCALSWVVASGPAVFRNPSQGRLSLLYNAEIGDEVVVYAIAGNNVISNSLKFTVDYAPGEVLKGLLLSAEGNISHVIAGGSVGLNLSAIPQEYDLNKSTVSYFFAEGGEFARIVNDVLYVGEKTPNDAVIRIAASVGEVKSNDVTVRVLKSAYIRDDDQGLQIFVPSNMMIERVNLTVINESGVALDKHSFLSGEKINLDSYGAAYSGNMKLALEFKLKSGEVCYQALNAHSLYGGGNGTQKEPYLLLTKRHFANIEKEPKAVFSLKSDLDILSDDTWSTIPLFEGTLLGNHHAIRFSKLLSVNMNTGKNVEYGVIAANNKGRISNLILEGLSYQSQSNYHNGTYFIAMGGVVGVNHASGVIENVIVKKGSFKCDRNNSSFGAISGLNNGVIRNCSVENAELYTTGDGGGVAGRLQGGSIESCSFSGQIDLYVANDNGGKNLRSWGGIVGYTDSSSTIKNCKVESCKFNYHGENAIYHKYFLWFHSYCELQIRVGIVCGSMKESTTAFAGNTYVANSCAKTLNRVGGDFHYGNHEKAYLFASKNGMVGRCF